MPSPRPDRSAPPAAAPAAHAPAASRPAPRRPGLRPLLLGAGVLAGVAGVIAAALIGRATAADAAPAVAAPPPAAAPALPATATPATTAPPTPPAPTPATPAPAAATSAPAVASPAADAAATDLNACGQPGAAAAYCANPPTGAVRLVVESVGLPSATVGKAYERRLLAGGGTPGYRFAPDGALPPGLELAPDGRLVGTPTGAGSYRFAVRVTDSATPPGNARQSYSLRVLAPPRAPASAPAAAQPAPLTLPGAGDVALDGLRLREALAWQLDAADIEALIKGEAAAPAANAANPAGSDPAAAPAPPAPLGARDQQAQEILNRLLGVEFPTEAQFASSLDDVACDYARGVFAEELNWPLAAVLARQRYCKARGALDGPAASGLLPANAGDARAAMPEGVAAPATDTGPAGASLRSPRSRLTVDELVRDILPDDLRRAVVQRAMKRHAFPSELAAADLWQASAGCDCVPEGLKSLTYGFFPFWNRDPKAPAPTLDFRVFKRIGYFALPFDEDGQLTPPARWQDAVTGAVRTARRYGSAMDLVLYRSQWGDLKRLLAGPMTVTGGGSEATAGAPADAGASAAGARPAAAKPAAKPSVLPAPLAALIGSDPNLQCDPMPAGDPVLRTPRAIANLVDQAMRIVETPLTDPASNLERHVPFFTAPGGSADGITLFFEPPPARDPAAPIVAGGAGGSGKTSAAAPYTAPADWRRFMRAFMPALIARMQAADRPLALNLVIPDRLLGDRDADPADADAAGGYDFASLLDWIKLAERPSMRGDRICYAGSDYRGSTRLTLQFLVLMTEPTKFTKKELRRKIDLSTALSGSNRTVVSRKLIPILTPGTYGKPGSAIVDDEVQLLDDLAYAQNNFGGVGFWALPLAAHGIDLPDKLVETFVDSRRRGDNAVCGLLCPNRWPLRIAVEALGVLELAGFALYWAVCRVQRWGRRYLLGLMLGGIVFTALALGMLSCDPALAGVREGNAPFIALIAALLLWALYEYLNPRTEQP
ncbi:Ig domain-containing protein [Derxia lacustris]|uniref:Ig domain-containing protein n=1 Tax=Derxia lacustris TaxID=764842 RepID=UPI00111C33AA|nr:Ig domain-containing protein [Derxia lacustris]